MLASRRSTDSNERDLRVLYSFGRPRPTTNPYIAQLLASVGALTHVETFSWRRALVGRYDALHFHWPENLLRGRTPPRTVGRHVAFSALLLRLHLQRNIRVVQTRHNTRPHEDLSPISLRLLRVLNHRTDRWILLSNATDGSPTNSTVILHGHYRDWFVCCDQPAPSTGGLLLFGHLRPYKGIEQLLCAFEGMQDAGMTTLTIAGQPITQAYGDGLVRRAEAISGVTIVSGFLEEEYLRELICECRVVILPYLEVLNSGAALLALSLGRSVILPDTPTNRDLRDEVGDEWVYLFTPPLTPPLLDQLIRDASRHRDLSVPDLTGRDWGRTAEMHVEVYRGNSVEST